MLFFPWSAAGRITSAGTCITAANTKAKKNITLNDWQIDLSTGSVTATLNNQDPLKLGTFDRVPFNDKTVDAKHHRFGFAGAVTMTSAARPSSTPCAARPPSPPAICWTSTQTLPTKIPTTSPATSTTSNGRGCSG
ncbi:hypothetical protein SMC26_23200 [Actinomadura fulvescens]|uniref:Uncharacterized protein n=1 Tax=Actinomadura fulvescens TaxID=46160 RepID=A0ABN3QXC6_9ACTN